MKTYSSDFMIKVNYTLFALEDVENFRHTYVRLETLFNKRQTPGKSKLLIPYSWSAIVLHFVTLAMETDPHVMFRCIEERNGTLHVDFVSSHIVYENEIEEHLYEARYRIDILTHSRISRAVKMRVTDDAI